MKKYTKMALSPKGSSRQIIASGVFDSPLEAAGSLILPGVVLELLIVNDKIESVKEHDHGTCAR